MKTLTVNISLTNKRPTLIDDESHIIDLFRTINNCNNQIVNNSFLDESIINGGLKHYDNLINEFYSNEELLSFKIFNYSLFNFSTNAQKTWPSWEVNFCTFLFLIKKKGRLLNHNYNFFYIILPPELKQNEKQIKSYLLKNEVNKNIIFIQTSSIKRYTINFKYFLSKILLLKKYLFLKSNPVYKIKSKNMNIFFTGGKGDNSSEIFLNLKSIFLSNKKAVIRFSNVFNWSDNNKNIDYLYFKYRPSLFEIGGLYLSLLWQKKKLNSMKSLKLKINEHEFNGLFIKSHLAYTLNHPYTFKLLIDFLWLRKFCFSISEKTNFFFTDEFYISGKLISAASKLNSTKITTYGLQHNSIDKSHITYRLSPSEIVKNWHYPDYFLVWNNAYKNLLIENNVNRATKIIITGSAVHNFSKNSEKYINKDIITFKKDKIIILWTLSNNYQFNIEIGIIKKCTNLNDFYFIIRNHPNSHVNLNNIKNKLKIINYNISENRSLEQDLVQSEIIICAYFSTIAYDAEVLGKNVILMCDVGFRNAAVNGINQLYCSSSSEFETIINNYKDHSSNNIIKKSNSIKNKNKYDSALWKRFISRLN